MKEVLIKTFFVGTGAFAVGSIDPGSWGTIATIASIILGWVWIESRQKSNIKEAMDAHTAVENEWRKAVEEKLDRLFDVLPKRKDD